MSKMLGFFSTGMVIGFSLVAINYSLIKGQVSLAPIRMQDSVTFLHGTNESTSGVWSMEQVNLFNSWPAEKRNTFARQEAFDRIKSDPIKFLSLVHRKFIILMSSDYGVTLSLNSINWRLTNQRFSSMYDFLIKNSQQVLQSINIVIFIFALGALKKFNDNPLPLIILFVVLSTLGPHIILEVQGRYHHYIMPFIILLTAYGITYQAHPAQLPLAETT